MGSVAKSWTFLEQANTKTVIPNKVMQVLIAGRVGERILTPSAIRVYLALRTRAYLRKREATEEELVAVTGLDRRSVHRALMELWEVGLIEMGPVGYWAPPDPVLGAVHLGEGGPEAAHPVSRTEHPLHGNVHPMSNPPRANALQHSETHTSEVIDEVKRKKDQHQHGHGPKPVAAEEESSQKVKTLSSCLRKSVCPSGNATHEDAVHLGEEGSKEDDERLPSAFSERSMASDLTSRGHVKVGTKPLQEVLKWAGLWKDFYRIFRPSFAQEFLWVRYLRRLEEQALPRGEAFLQAVARTLEGAARGVVRHPTAYLEALLREVAVHLGEGGPKAVGGPSGGGEPQSGPQGFSPPPLGEGEVQDGVELLLPDGRRGYFAGWTQGGRKGFVEVDGVALCLDREVLLALPVVR